MKVSDFLEIKNYYKKPGQSGKLGLAIDINGVKYLLKRGEYGEPANEYVYSLIAKQVGVSCQTCHLVEGFGHPVVALRYIQQLSPKRKKSFDYNLISDDLIKSRALDVLTDQDDHLQYIISDNGRFCKIDNSEAFGFNYGDEQILLTQELKYVEAYLKDIENNTNRILGMIKVVQEDIVKSFGNEKMDVFNKTLIKFLQTDFDFLLNDAEILQVYSKETSKYFFAKIQAAKKAVNIVL